MDVVLVGPIPPWRSGIADQTVRLARALIHIGVAPTIVTFRRMYPGLLYPGVSDRDTGTFPDDLPDVRPILDGMNPFSFRSAARLVASMGPRLVILPWWTSWWAPHDAIFLSALASSSPSTVPLLLCHNLADHDGGRALSRALSRSVFHRVGRFVVQNRGAAERLRRELPAAQVEFIPHPSEPCRVLPDRERARAVLGVPVGAKVFLFTGILRPYKGWDLLVRAFTRMKDEHPEALLVLAGEPWGKERGLAKRVEDRQVRLELRYLPEGERSLWLDACDAVVCPYRDATGSGVAADAISHGRPVIGTRVDGLVDVIEEGETGLLVPAEDAPALADALRRFIREDLGSRLSANVVARRGRFAPEDHARRILKLGGIPCGA